MSERLLPPREACRRFGIHFVTLKRWIYSGKVRAVKTPTGRWMIPESEIERIIGGKEGVDFGSFATRCKLSYRYFAFLLQVTPYSNKPMVVDNVELF